MGISKPTLIKCNQEFSKEVANLDTFKSNEGDRKKQIQGLKERIRDQEEKIP